jgi:hypothetical protein
MKPVRRIKTPAAKTAGAPTTKHEKPIAPLIPTESDCAGLIGSMKGKAKVTGDIFSTGVQWDAES